MNNNLVQINIDASSPVIATAIHHGNSLSADFLKKTSLPVNMRLQEEDPYTGQLASLAPSSIICHKSRFECDLNRPLERAVYLQSEDAWGLPLWSCQLNQESIDQAHAYHRKFYEELHQIYSDLIERHGRIIVLDFHSYNYRRGGIDAKPSPESTHPSINIGTGTMSDRENWDDVIAGFVSGIESYSFFGKPLNVQENLIFKGGYHPLWAHSTFPGKVCVLSIEIKKFFMDEWTGKLYTGLFEELKKLFRSEVELLAELARPQI